MAKLRQNSGCYDYVNSGDSTINSGDPIVNNNIFGFAVRSAKPGEACAVQVDGIWEITVTASTTAAIGATAYWDASTSKVTTVASTNLPIGVFTKAVAATDDTCEVMINVGAIGTAAASGSGAA